MTTIVFRDVEELIQVDFGLLEIENDLLRTCRKVIRDLRRCEEGSSVRHFVAFTIQPTLKKIKLTFRLQDLIFHLHFMHYPYRCPIFYVDKPRLNKKNMPLLETLTGGNHLILSRIKHFLTLKTEILLETYIANDEQRLRSYSFFIQRWTHNTDLRIVEEFLTALFPTRTGYETLA